MTKCLKVIYKKEENNMNTEITKEKKYTIEQLGTKLEKLESKIKKIKELEVEYDSFKEKMSKLVFLGTFDKVSNIKLGK